MCFHPISIKCPKQNTEAWAPWTSNSSTDRATRKGMKMMPEVVAITEAIFACGLPGYLGWAHLGSPWFFLNICQKKMTNWSNHFDEPDKMDRFCHVTKVDHVPQRCWPCRSGHLQSCALWLPSSRMDHFRRNTALWQRPPWFPARTTRQQWSAVTPAPTDTSDICHGQCLKAVRHATSLRQRHFAGPSYQMVKDFWWFLSETLELIINSSSIPMIILKYGELFQIWKMLVKFMVLTCFDMFWHHLSSSIIQDRQVTQETSNLQQVCGLFQGGTTNESRGEAQHRQATGHVQCSAAREQPGNIEVVNPQEILGWKQLETNKQGNN